MGKYQIVSAYPADKGKSYLARFDCILTEPPPCLEIKDYYESTDGKKHRPVLCEIMGASMIRMKSCYLRLDKHGAPIASFPIEVPYDLGREIAASVYQSISDRLPA